MVHNLCIVYSKVFIFETVLSFVGRAPEVVIYVKIYILCKNSKKIVDEYLRTYVFQEKH
jgi:hypothetical protein